MAQLDALLTSDQEVAGSTPTGQHHSFLQISHENIFCCHSLPSADSRRAVVSYW